MQSAEQRVLVVLWRWHVREGGNVVLAGCRVEAPNTFHINTFHIGHVERFIEPVTGFLQIASTVQLLPVFFSLSLSLSLSVLY